MLLGAYALCDRGVTKTIETENYYFFNLKDAGVMNRTAVNSSTYKYIKIHIKPSLLGAGVGYLGTK